MSHVDEGLLHAWLDGAFEAGAPERLEIETHLAQCADCRVRLDDARRMKEEAQLALTAVAPSSIEPPPWDRIVAEHARRTPAGAAAPQPRRRTPMPLAWAATVLIALGAGWMGRAMLTGRDAELQLAPASSLEQESNEELRDAVGSRALPATPPAQADAAQAAAVTGGDTSAPPATVRTDRDEALARNRAPAAASVPQELQLKAATIGSIAGEVRDSATNRPIEGALVSVNGSARVSVTDAAGQFRIDSLPAGRHAVEVASLGYGTEQRTLDLRAEGAAALEFRLSQQTIALDEVVVTGQAQRPERRALGASLSAREEAVDTVTPTLLGVPLENVSWNDVAATELAARLGVSALEVEGMTPDSAFIANVGQITIARSVYGRGETRVELLQRAEQAADAVLPESADTLVANRMRGLRFVVRGHDAAAVAEVLRRLR